MKRIAVIVVCFLALAACFALAGCDEGAAGSKVVVERVDGYKPNLPPIPSIPKPNVPETYDDGSYSVYGLRKKIGNTINNQVTVTAFIAKMYEKPVCPEGKTCHTLMPHLFLADDKDEEMARRHLRLVGYARSFKEMEDEKEAFEKGEEAKELPEGVYLPPVVWDWRPGHKYKITGMFTRQSGEGFMDTDGLLDYQEHECLDCPVEEEEEEGKKK